MSVEERRVRAHAQRVQPQQHLLQQLPRIQAARLIVPQLLLHKCVQVGEDGIILRRKLPEVRFLRNAPLLIQLGQHDLDGIQLRVGELLVGAKEILQEGDVPRQQRGLAERLGDGLVCFGSVSLIPAPHLQHIDALLTGHKVDEAAA